MENGKPLRLVISAASACGKTTIMDHLVNKHEFTRLRTTTTRVKRDSESDDDYYFFDAPTFIEMQNDGHFIESSIVYGNHYGLLRSEVMMNLCNDFAVILDIQGTQKFIKEFPDAITIFLLPPVMDEIQARLESRSNNHHDIKVRMETAKKEVLASKKYQYRVKPGTIEQVQEQLDKIIENLRNSTHEH